MKRRISDFKKVTLFTVMALAMLAVLAPLAFAQMSAEKGDEIYQQKCSGCHSIGKGDTTRGPDLQQAGVKRSDDWLHSILEDPDELAASGDADIKELMGKFGDKVMPNLNLSDDEVGSLILFLKSDAVISGKVGCKEYPGGNAEEGRKLFVGETAQQNGGTACIACHNAGDLGPSGLGLMGGGSMAKDLTNLYATTNQCPGGALANLNYPVMTDVFRDKPLNEDEIADLSEYFKSIDKQSPPSNTVSMITLFLVGMTVFVILLIISQLIWGKRIQGVRKRLVGGSK